MKVLIVSFQDAFRSRLAQGFLQSFMPSVQLETAAIEPAKSIHAATKHLLYESFIELNDSMPQSIRKYANQKFSKLIIVCEKAKQQLPEWASELAEQIVIIPFPPIDEKLCFDTEPQVFRDARDQIKQQMFLLFKEYFSKK